MLARAGGWCPHLAVHGDVIYAAREVAGVEILKINRPQLAATGVNSQVEDAINALDRLGVKIEYDDEGLPRALSLYGKPLTAEQLRQIGVLTTLRDLSLRNCRIGDGGVAHLARLKELEQLDLTETDVTDAGMKHLAKITTLCDVNLARTAVTPKGLSQLRSLKALKFVGLAPDLPKATQARATKALPNARVIFRV